ncbi:unnamed protein product [Closterium sp. Yama58-4]|nr:unnamed protein product [Closterium sp. Yama58-4]
MCRLMVHERTSASIAKLQDIDDDMPKLCDTLVQELRELEGYDRVLLYRFHEDLHGEVVAEAKSEAQASLLGLHYPATDCPQVVAEAKSEAQASLLGLHYPATDCPQVKCGAVRCVSCSHVVAEAKSEAQASLLGLHYPATDCPQVKRIAVRCAEAKSEAQASLLGLHYPATDCPQINRTMFVDVRLRLIADVTAPDVHIIQHPSLSKNINLSRSTLKGVASCHKEYCANIGIGASLVMAVVVTTRGPQSTSVRKLWGLVVCHHMSPRFLPYPQRFACDFLLQVSSYNSN